jgi:hypothetical protein
MIKTRNQSTRQIPCEEGSTIEEALQPATQLDWPVEGNMVESHVAVELPSQPTRPVGPGVVGVGGLATRVMYVKIAMSS